MGIKLTNMTFEEAVKVKAELPERFVRDGMEYRTYITPKDIEDFLGAYRNAFDKHLITNESAKFYNPHNDYTVRGICYYRDVNLFYHVELPLL